jgi:hypothetical protein
MTLQEIKKAVNDGKTVHWSNSNYVVVKDNIGQWLIKSIFNNHFIGLTHRDEKTMNGLEDQFFIGENND